MVRLWGEITESKRIGKGKTAGPMPTFAYDLKVKVKGPFSKEMGLAGEVKDKELTVRRDTAFPKEFEKGRRIVLDAAESVPVASPLRVDNPIVEIRSGKAEVKVRVSALDKKLPEIKIEAKGVKAEWKRKPTKPKGGGHWAEGIVAISADSEPEEGVHTVTLTASPDKKSGGDAKKAPSITLMVPNAIDATCRRYRCDIDGDGFEEVVLENAWVRAVGSGRYGARLIAFENRATGVSPFAAKGDFGANDAFSRGGLAHLTAAFTWWGSRAVSGNIPIADAKPASGPDTAMAFRGALPGADGVTIEHSLAIVPDGPLGIARTTFHYAGKKKPADGEKKEDPGEKDEFKVAYRVPMPITFGREEELGRNARMDGIAFHLPCKKKMERRRYEPTPNDWFWIGWSEHFGMTSGYVAAEDEASGAALVMLCDADRLIMVEIADNWSFPILQPQFRNTRLGKDEQVTYPFILAVGDAVAATNDGVALLTLGAPKGKHVPIHVLARGRWGEKDEVRARIKSGKEIRMHRQYTPGVGGYWTGTAEVEAKKGGSVGVNVRIGTGRFSLSAKR
jgi:hypothetical protein